MTHFISFVFYIFFVVIPERPIGLARPSVRPSCEAALPAAGTHALLSPSPSLSPRSLRWAVAGAPRRRQDAEARPRHPPPRRLRRLLLAPARGRLLVPGGVVPPVGRGLPDQARRGAPPAAARRRPQRRRPARGAAPHARRQDPGPPAPRPRQADRRRHPRRLPRGARHGRDLPAPGQRPRRRRPPPRRHGRRHRRPLLQAGRRPEAGPRRRHLRLGRHVLRPQPKEALGGQPRGRLPARRAPPRGRHLRHQLHAQARRRRARYRRRKDGDAAPYLFDDFMTSEHGREEHRRSASEKQASEAGNVDVRHFALYAFSGRTGTLRWSRKNENIQAQPSDASAMIPQHNYKLDVHALNNRHPGEYECRQFRESILGVMPHHWDRREDTFLQLAHFRKHKRKELKKTQGKSVVNNVHKPIEHNPLGKDDTNRISKAIGKAADLAGSAKGKKSLHTLYIPTITNYTQVWWVPNVVVAHEKEGIEAIHLASGRTLCKLHLTEGGLHADINGDGVLDHVQVVGGNGAEQTVVSGSMEVLKPCWAVATSGVPVREQLFNVSICHYNHLNLFHHGDFSRSFGRTFDPSGLEVATPVLLQRDDGHKHRRGSHGDIIFLTSRGEVTSYTPGLLGHDAMWRWQLSTGATWSNLPSPSGMMENVVVPTLKTFSLRAYDPKQVIVVGGDQEAVVISPDGSLLASIDLPAPPTHALILEDFSGDGLTDIILVTSGGVYGFVQTRQPGALFFSTLVGFLIVVIGVIFVSLHLNSSNGGKPRSSTGYR